jgi:hypothetical protein
MSMRRGRLQVGLLLAFLSLAIVVAGCGGGSSSSSDPEPSAEFHAAKGKTQIPKFGEESSEEERETVNVVVVKSLKAREAADFKTQCETLNKKGIAEIPNAKNQKGCPAALKTFASPLSGTKEVRKDTLSGPIAALRVKGEEGYVLYHGNDGKDYAIPVEKEDGTWKLSSINVVDLSTKLPSTSAEDKTNKVNPSEVKPKAAEAEPKATESNP